MSKERPILFSSPMVRAILAGTKSQTRRIVKPRKDRELGCALAPCELAGEINRGDFRNSQYGQPGDRLWVRENGWERPECTPKMIREGADTWMPYYYDADGISESDASDFKAWSFKRRPSIHMPRVCCRLFLQISGVHIERLHEISNEDALAEGVNVHPDHHDRPRDSIYSPVSAYRDLLESINGKGTWYLNPWVWVIKFSRVEKPA